MASPLVFYQIATSDPGRTRAFLGDLFEWPATDPEGSDTFTIEPGGPADFDVQGQILPPREGAQQVTLFFRVADLWATVALAEERGATVVMPIRQMPTGVHVALITTPDDALTVGIVQA